MNLIVAAVGSKSVRRQSWSGSHCDRGASCQIRSSDAADFLFVHRSRCIKSYIDLPFREERAHLPIAKFIDFLKMRPEEIDLFSCQVNPIVHCTTTPTPGKHLNAILINCKWLDYDFFCREIKLVLSSDKNDHKNKVKFCISLCEYEL